MRRSRALRLADLPRIAIGGAVGLAGLLGGRYHRIEGANVLATDDAGRILAVRTLYIPDEWMLPGGRVERGETPHAAAIRETREETGLEVALDRLLIVDARDRRDVSFVFGGHVTGGELEPQLGEIVEAGWLGRDEIRRTAHGLDRLLVWIETAGGQVAYLGLGGDRA